MSSYTLTSLAILKVNWDRGKDYVENFVPFVVECARTNSEQVISLPTMQRMVKDIFQLDLPQHFLQTTIIRATKRGYFRRDSGAIYKVPEECNKLDFKSTKDAVEATYQRVITGLTEYATTSHGKSWSTEDAETALSHFLRDSSLSLLFDIADGKRSHSPSDGNRFLVGSFVQHAQDADPALLNDLELLARGNLLANVMYLPDSGRIRTRFRNTSIYFDTSFIMFAAGFAGPDRAAPCLELLELLTEYGAVLRCFKGTRNEVQGILDACASRLHRGDLRHAYGPTIEYFVEAGKSASDLELMSARLPAKLTDLGVKVVDPPSYDGTAYQIDEKGFEKYLEQHIGYSNPAARVHDVDCISAITRQRQGREYRDVEECRALFVTTNSKLVRVTAQFFQRDTPRGAVAFATTDYGLANLLWLKDPTIAPTLPRRRLIADAYAAMQPTPNLWNAYLTEIATLEEDGKVTADDYLLLRHSLHAKTALMDLTDGHEDVFTEGSINAILEVTKEKLRADLRAEVSDQRRQTLEVQEELQSKQQETLALRLRLRRGARWVARIARLTLFVVSFPLLVLGVLLTFPWTLPVPAALWKTYITPSVLLLVFFLMLGNLMLGTTLRDLANRFEDCVAGMMIRVIFKLVGLPSINERDG